MLKPKVVFTICHKWSRGFGEVTELNVQRKFTESMDALAKACVGQEELEFLILFDKIAFDIIGSNQDFFEDELEEALSKVGLKNISVKGRCGGTINRIIEIIREKYPDWSPDFCTSGEGFILYTVIT
ncbi:hypothetical protein ACFL08_02065 [Patescibacteria group bacterium]